MARTWLIALFFTLLTACALGGSNPATAPANPTRIAFIADAHFHDIYGELSDNSHQGIPTTTGDGTKNALIRSMRAQLHSTRLFNESYFVLLAALEDIAQRGVKLVALPGDFSDDGQPIHLRGLASILQRYQRVHGIQFFAIPGNHDPVRPYTTESGKSDFLSAQGKEIAIFSRAENRCNQGEGELLVCSDDLQNWGYQEIMEAMAGFGFYPRADYIHYETPFSASNGNQFDFVHRQLKWCENISPQRCVQMPDASYLVEPIEGLWLLAIDANVYAPRDPNELSTRGEDYRSSSNAGYNAMLKYKPEIIDWIAEVAERADLEGKQLIAFSHFPMVDFYDTAGNDLAALFGPKKQQLPRLPLDTTTQALANTGLRLHVGGHMHINDTGSVQADNGQIMFNIQAPSLAAYRPAYKLMTISDADEIDVETVVLDKVERYRELFPHYRKEWSYLAQHQPDKIWTRDILDVQSYGEFTEAHLQELVRLRYIPKEWPAELVALLEQSNFARLRDIARSCRIDVQDSQPLPEQLPLLTLPGSEVVYDFYRLRNADSLAHVSETRKSFYVSLANSFTRSCSKENELLNQLDLLFQIIKKFIDSQPSSNFRINLKTGTLQTLSEN